MGSDKNGLRIIRNSKKERVLMLEFKLNTNFHNFWVAHILFFIFMKRLNIFYVLIAPPTCSFKILIFLNNLLAVIKGWKYELFFPEKLSATEACKLISFRKFNSLIVRYLMSICVNTVLHKISKNTQFT